MKTQRGVHAASMLAVALSAKMASFFCLGDGTPCHVIHHQCFAQHVLDRIYGRKHVLPKHVCHAKKKQRQVSQKENAHATMHNAQCHACQMRGEEEGEGERFVRPSEPNRDVAARSR